MIDYQTFMQIKFGHQEGLSCPQIANKLEIDERTVHKWLQKDRYSHRQSSPKSSKLDPFKDYIFRRLQEYPFSATQIYQKLQEMEYAGGLTIVKDYVRKIRPKPVHAFLKLSFAPGECAQVDWGTYGTVKVGSTRRKLHFFVMVLCYSRMMYVEFTVSQSMEHFLACHQNAFYKLGVPHKIMIDNLKTGVLKPILGEDPILNPKYLDFANHYGFRITPCAVAKGNEKGRVENGVGYVKKNFLAGFEIPDFSIVNPAATQWLNTISNVRIHGETGKKPVDMFPEEKDSLIAASTLPYDAATIKPVRACKQFRIVLDTNRYSVPAEYAGQRLSLKIYPDKLCIYHQDKLIARHIRSFDRRQDIENPDHPKELIAQRKKAKDQKILMRFLILCPNAHIFCQQMQNRRLNSHHHITKIVALSEIYGTDNVAKAIDAACEIQAFSSEYILNVIQQRQRILPDPQPLVLTCSQDMLDIHIPEPDMSIYDKTIGDPK